MRGTHWIYGLALAACGGDPPPLKVEAAWDDTHHFTGCEKRELVLDVHGAAGVAVTAAGMAGTTDRRGDARLRVRPSAISGAEVEVVAGGARRRVAVPPLPSERAVSMGQDKAPPGASWRARATGDVGPGTDLYVEGVLEGDTLRVPIDGCDLRSGTVTPGGAFVRLDDDRGELRVPAAALLDAAAGVGRAPVELRVEVENTDGVKGSAVIVGDLDVAAALAGRYPDLAAAQQPVPTAAPWRGDGTDAIAVTGPDLDGVERANALLRGAKVGQAAGLLVLEVTQEPSDVRCGGYRDITSVGGGLPRSASTTRARVTAHLVARATGAVVETQAFGPTEAKCPPSLSMTGGVAETVAAAPPWAEILAWLEAPRAGR